MLSNISVVIPVYNAAPFLQKAVDSALSQPEVAEVLLVEDASQDGSHIICQDIQKRDKRVKLLIHKGHTNKGPSESRNLGIKTAANDFVAFLDADDFYLPNRFQFTKNVFLNHPDADAVCEGVGTAFKDESTRSYWLKRGFPLLTTLKEAVAPEHFFWTQEPMGSGGYAHINGWTIKKEVFAKVGFFNPVLWLHQDTDFFMRIAMSGTVYSGQIKAAVAMRRLHDSNRITASRPVNKCFIARLDMWLSTLRWSFLHRKRRERRALMAKLLRHLCDSCLSKHNEYAQRIGIMWAISNLFKRHPRIFLLPEFYIELIACFRRRARSLARSFLERKRLPLSG